MLGMRFYFDLLVCIVAVTFGAYVAWAAYGSFARRLLPTAAGLAMLSMLLGSFLSYLQRGSVDFTPLIALGLFNWACAIAFYRDGTFSTKSFVGQLAINLWLVVVPFWLNKELWTDAFVAVLVIASVVVIVQFLPVNKNRYRKGVD